MVLNTLKGSKSKDFLVNESIDFSQIRVVDEDGKMLGVMTSTQGLKLAKGKKLDLVVMAPDADIPVAKIMDYNRFKFDQKKKRKQSKVGQKKQDTKEVKMLLNIQQNDYQVKLNRAKSFLQDKDKVRFSVRLRGREMNCASLVKDLFNKIQNDLQGLANLDTASSSDFIDIRNNYFLVFFPVK